MFLWAQQDKHGTPGRDEWTWSTGLGIAAASGLESAPIRWAWVSGDPAGMSQRRSGGLESAAIRRALSQRRAGGLWVRGGPAGIESEAGWRALSQRRAGGHWVSGDPAGIESEAGRRALSQRRAGGVISREWRAWGSGNPGTSRRAWESHRRRQITPAIGGHEGIAAIGLAALVAIPPNSHALLQWAMAGLRAATSLPRDRHKQTKLRNKNKNFQKRKQNEVKGRRLLFRSGLLSRCTHEGGTGTRRRGH